MVWVEERGENRPAAITEFENFLALRSSERQTATDRFKKPTESH